MKLTNNREVTACPSTQDILIVLSILEVYILKVSAEFNFALTTTLQRIHQVSQK